MISRRSTAFLSAICLNVETCYDCRRSCRFCPVPLVAMQKYNEELVKAGILLAAIEDFGDEFTPNAEIAKVKIT